MSFSTQNDDDRNAGVMDAEQTLRLIAALPAPEGLGPGEGPPHAAPRKAGVISWPTSATGALDAASLRCGPPLPLQSYWWSLEEPGKYMRISGLRQSLRRSYT